MSTQTMNQVYGLPEAESMPTRDFCKFVSCKNRLASAIASWATESNNEKFVNNLIKDEPKLKAVLTGDNDFVYELLVSTHAPQALRWLLKNGVSFAINDQYMEDHRRETVVHRICASGNGLHPEDEIMMLKDLIAYGADVNCKRNEDGLSPVQIAACAQKDHICQVLRENGAIDQIVSKL